MDPQATALRKAAILVTCLDTSTADALLAQMPAEQAALVRRAMVALEQIDPIEQQDVIDEFVRHGQSVNTQVDDGIEIDVDLARRLDRPQSPAPTTTEAVRMRRSSRPVEPPEPASHEPPFRFLHQAADERLAAMLDGERPQTIALVISHLPADRAARVLAPLESAMQVEVFQRLVELDQADPQTVREVECSLQSRAGELIQAQHRRTAGLTAVARILEAADRATRQSLVGNLMRHDRRLSSQLQLARPNLSFEELTQLDTATVATVFNAAPSEVVVLALVGADADVAQRIAARLPADRSRLVRQSFKNLGPTRLADVEQAQLELVRIARELESAGQIVLQPLLPDSTRIAATAA
jgi:flagellar motor switch protein FliG